MQTLFMMSKHLHMAAALLLIVSQAAFFLIKTTDFVAFTRKLRNLLLVQNVIIGMVVFTGLLLLAVLKFEVWNVAIILMIFVITGVIVHQILINKKRKPIRSNEIELQNVYKKWVAKVYGAEIAAEVIVFLVAML